LQGIYGMNFKNMPELEWDHGYPAAIGLMVISFVIALIYFKTHKRHFLRMQYA
jgi:magnesium transporter